MSEQHEINRGEYARQILENPIYQEGITAIKAKIFDDWANTNWLQYRKRQECWRLYRAAEALENYIQKVLTTGKMARKSLDDRERLKKVS